jgi:V/A-type H+/Na+-transporting ATPase subunit C
MQKLKLKQQGSNEKIKLGFNPYPYVRTAVMRSLLFKAEDYQKLLKMGFNEIAKFLQDTNYRKEINELGTQYSGSDLLELALNRSLAGSFKKLMRISSNELGLLITEYAKRKDIEDIKTIIRGKFTDTDEKEIEASITGAGTLSYDLLASLMKKESVEQILKSIQIADFNMFKGELKELDEKKSLAGIENALDRHYYTQLLNFSRRLTKPGALFRDFIQKEVEILNLLTLLRLKKAKLDKNMAKNFLISSGDRTKDSKMAELANMEDLDQIAKSLQKTEYGNIVLNGIEEFKKTNSLIKLETELYKHLLKKSILFMHQHLLSADVILGYMFAKDIEVRNLRIIIKGKQLGLSEQFIEGQLIYE